MRTLAGLLGRILLACLVAAVLTFAISRQPRQPSMTVLVPAYFYPTGSGARAWDELCTCGPVRSGPGNPQSRQRPGQSAATRIMRLRSSGSGPQVGGVIGYVHTSYGAREIGDVKSEIEAYLALYDIDGFFIDEMATDPFQVPYYTGLYTFIKRRNAGFEVIGNPGTSTDPVYRISATADTLVLFEGTPAGFRHYRPPSWALSYAPRGFAAIIHGARNGEELRRILARSVRAHLGALFITDGAGSNPYDHLPSYWEDEVGAVKAIR